jgi:tellurite resistance protein
MLVRVLFQVACIDGVLHSNEEKLLRYVAAQVQVPMSEVQVLIDNFFAISQ